MTWLCGKCQDDAIQEHHRTCPKRVAPQPSCACAWCKGRGETIPGAECPMCLGSGLQKRPDELLRLATAPVRA